MAFFSHIFFDLLVSLRNIGDGDSLLHKLASSCGQSVQIDLRIDIKDIDTHIQHQI